jgi:hypothetical protein
MKDQIPLEIPTILKLAKSLGITFPRNALNNDNYFKNRETGNLIKERLNIMVNQVILENSGL